MKKRMMLLVFVVFITAFALAKEYQRLDIVGDSISHGVNPVVGDNSGWVQMLTGSYDSQSTIYQIWSGITVNNQAVSGSRASDWAGSTYIPMTTVISHHPDLVVVYIGGNDLLAYASDGQFTESEKTTFRTNLRTIIDTLQSNTPRPDIIMVNYYDLFDGYSANLPSLFTAYRVCSSGAVDGNQIIKEVALEKGCYMIDTVYTQFMHHAYGTELGDTGHLSPDYVRTPLASFDIHPITAGHRVIYQDIYNKLRELKGLTSVSDWACFE
jgi:lysophospholipase L1-like esterase